MSQTPRQTDAPWLDPPWLSIVVPLKNEAENVDFVTEAIVAEFLDRGYYDTHLTHLQRELDRRYALCIEALTALMPDDVRWTRPGGGPTLWLEVPDRVDLAVCQKRLAQRGVAIEATANHFIGSPHMKGFRVSFAYSQPEALRRALEIVADELKR